jgi:hypothetical protein
VEHAEAFDRALLHSKGKPLTGLQAKILKGSIRRLELPDQMYQQAEQAKSALEAEALLTKIETEFLHRRYGRARKS